MLLAALCRSAHSAQTNNAVYSHHNIHTVSSPLLLSYMMQALITGPVDTPYDSGCFQVRIRWIGGIGGVRAMEERGRRKNHA